MQEGYVDVVQEIQQQVGDQCSVSAISSFITPFETETAYGALDHLKCVLNVLDNVLNTAETELANLWQTTRNQLETVVQKLKQCREQPMDEAKK